MEIVKHLEELSLLNKGVSEKKKKKKMKLKQNNKKAGFLGMLVSTFC